MGGWVFYKGFKVYKVHKVFELCKFYEFYKVYKLHKLYKFFQKMKFVEPQTLVPKITTGANSYRNMFSPKPIPIGRWLLFSGMARGWSSFLWEWKSFLRNRWAFSENWGGRNFFRERLVFSKREGLSQKEWFSQRKKGNRWGKRLSQKKNCAFSEKVSFSEKWGLSQRKNDFLKERLLP